MVDEGLLGVEMEQNRSVVVHVEPPAVHLVYPALHFSDVLLRPPSKVESVDVDGVSRGDPAYLLRFSQSRLLRVAVPYPERVVRLESLQIKAQPRQRHG